MLMITDLNQENPPLINAGDAVTRAADGTWGFYDESWAFFNGGYATEAEARAALSTYLTEFLGC